MPEARKGTRALPDGVKRVARILRQVDDLAPAEQRRMLELAIGLVERVEDGRLKEPGGLGD